MYLLLFHCDKVASPRTRMSLWLWLHSFCLQREKRRSCSEIRQQAASSKHGGRNRKARAHIFNSKQRAEREWALYSQSSLLVTVLPPIRPYLLTQPKQHQLGTKSWGTFIIQTSTIDRPSGLFDIHILFD